MLPLLKGLNQQGIPARMLHCSKLSKKRWKFGPLCLDIWKIKRCDISTAIRFCMTQLRMPVFFPKKGIPVVQQTSPSNNGIPQIFPKNHPKLHQNPPKSLKKSPPKTGFQPFGLPEIEPQWLPELAPNLFARADPTKLSKRCGSQPLGWFWR